MNDVAEALASRRLNNTAKTVAILSHLGGRATTGEIIAAGLENGAKSIRTWDVGSLLAKCGERVTKLPSGWKLLTAGRTYLEKQGVTFEVPQPLASNSQGSTSDDHRPRVTICHGRSRVWKDLKEFLRDHYGVEVQEFNSASVVGLSTKERLANLLSSSDIAFVVMTAEDEQVDGKLHARMNVAHEVGFFQGGLGFEKTAVCLEEGCEEFSNLGCWPDKICEWRHNVSYRGFAAFLR